MEDTWAIKKDIIMKMVFKQMLLVQIVSALTAFIGPLIDGIIISDFLDAASMASFGIVTPVTISVAAILRFLMQDPKTLPADASVREIRMH